ncbi:T6SS effector phospholipase Tle3 domain-containing protein, partial [Pseudomonas aeruginosa]|uniref:T6SS effector phospholipase Tle3 domain-containing protein n=1 Tax=Pseudomonas aeruginosa TaxID=287 RepID=UPI003D767D06
PADDEGKAENPDAVYYRRKFASGAGGAAVRSVIVPFYWGFREEEQYINKTAAHGEWLDRNGNRLDKSGTKEGGQFVNATTNLPDMWGQGFNGKLFGFISLDWFGGTMTHPLFSAAGRKYMVLAAMRLAMLIKIIRKRYPDDTINVVGHSQGTLLTLLAHAFLKDDGVAPADGVIMLNSPYGLFEPLNEKLQGWSSQQTREARLATLKGILEFICGRRHPVPALSSVALRNCQGYGAIGGPGWVGGQGCQTTIDGERLSFDERDNRGSVYLYFTPQDQTVGLANVQGICW